MALYRIYGLEVDSELAFTAPLPPGAPPADVTIERVESAPLEGWEGSPPVFLSPRRTADGEVAALLHRAAGWEILRFSGLYDFFLSSPDAEDGPTARILVRPTPAASARDVETRLLGPVLAYWLERRGVLALHASGLVLDGQAVVFLSDNGGGKSSLAATALAAGQALLSDDLVAVARTPSGFEARAAYPEMRLWPPEASHFLGGFEELPRVEPRLEKRRVAVGGDGFGRFCPTAERLAALVVPERLEAGDGDVELLPLSPAAAVMQLVRHSYSPYIVEGAGLQPERLGRFAEIVATIPAWRLRYPSGHGHLPRVLEVLRGAVRPGA